MNRAMRSDSEWLMKSISNNDSRSGEITPAGGVFVALGSNDKGAFASVVEQLEAALDHFPAHGLRVLARSSWWRSQAWPDPNDPPFLNGVVQVRADLTPLEVMAALAAIEAEFGRTRGRRNAPRTLDLDLVAYGDVVIDDARLILPHPRAAQRLFVMGPLAEIAPDWVHPVLGCTARDLELRATIGLDARGALEA